MKSIKQNPLAFLFFTISIVVVCISLAIIFDSMFKLKNQYIITNNLKNELAEVKAAQEKLKEENNKLQSQLKTIRSPNVPTCPKYDTKDENIIKSSDNKYFYFFENNSFVVCDNNDPENPAALTHFESRVQNGYWRVDTIYGDLMFYANLKEKTLNYLSVKDFPFVVSDMYFFGPQVNDINAFSPDTNKVIFAINDGCHDCDASPLYFALNLKTGNLTKLGMARSWEWIDNNYVKWMEIVVREKTAEDYEKDPYSFPVVIEEKGYVVTKVL